MSPGRVFPWKGLPARERPRPTPFVSPHSIGGNDTNTLLLCPFDTGFADVSSHNRAMTGHNSIGFTSANQHFPGNSLTTPPDAFNLDYVDTPDNADWNFGTADFTIDCWYFPIASNSTMRLATTVPPPGPTTGFNFNVTPSAASPSVSFQTFNAGPINSDDTAALSAGDIQLNTWYHFAVTRASNTLRIFFNGVSKALTHPGAAALGAGTIPYSAGTTFQIFEDIGAIGGQMQEFRVSKIARWTASFTPPTRRYS